MLLRRTAIGLVLALLVALPVGAQDFEKGMAAYKRGDFATAYLEWRPLAGQGNASAQTNIGIMCAGGQGVLKDDVLAHMWLSLAAAKGHKKGSNARDIVAKRMTPAQIAEAQKLARDWWAKHPKKK